MGKLSESQKRLDGALACPGLSNKDSVESLVERQLRRSPSHGTEEEFKSTVKNRTVEVSDFLDMLRSASRNNKDPSSGLPQNDWKVKQESDQLRVMYREGPPGTPFHTLLCEGYVDGPVDSCLCVSWESTLFKKWWPQYNIPTFKITFSSSLQKIGIGEEIILLRVKVPWPMSDREAIVHCFELEFFEEDLVIVLMNSVPETKGIDTNINGHLNNGIPEEENIVRIDVIGGFALQKVSSGRSYFRGIANMDIKLDFVPPSLINFLSRQLIGNGHKLYSKAVAAVTAGDKDYEKALKGAMYERIRDGLYSSSRPKTADKDVSIKNRIEDTVVKALVDDSNISLEIIEESVDENIGFAERQHIVFSSAEASLPRVVPEQDDICDQRISVSLEVQQALGILDRAIAVYRDLQSGDSQTNFDGASKNPGSADGKKVISTREDHLSADVARTATSCIESSLADKNLSKEQTHDSVTLESSNEHVSVLQQNQLGSSVDASTKPTLKSSSLNGTLNEVHMAAQTSVLERMSKVFDEVSARTNGAYHNVYSNDESKLKRSRDKRMRKSRCCWSFS